jgi:hypothetical protein
MAGKIIHCGDSGAGQAAKLCNNMLLAVQQIAVGEAFVLAEGLGLSASSLFDVITGATGNCWAMHTNCPVPGREMASLVAVPNSTTVLPDAYYWGGSIAAAASNWVSALHTRYLPNSGAIILSGGGSATIPATADAAVVKARLDAANSGAGWLSSGPSTVTGSMPRFIVSLAAPAGTGAGGIQALSTLEPSCTVRIGEKQKAGMATPLVFEIVVTPAAQKVAATASVAETVSTLLVEEKLGSLLGRTNLTVLPGRAGDESRVPLATCRREVRKGH